MNTAITGKIDRVDMYRKDDKIYVKVIDYKSGSNKISLDEIYNGVKLQLMVYLHSIVNDVSRKFNDKKVIPAGAVYNHIDSPIVRIEKTSVDTVEEYKDKLLEALRPEGIINYYAVDCFDEWESGKSKAVALKKKKDGTIEIGDDVVTSEQLNCLTEYAVKKMHSMQEMINKGETEANPLESACTYCAFSRVCGFDSKKHSYRKLESLKNDPNKWVRFGYTPNEEGEN